MEIDHLIFSHIHKTAGQSLKRIINRHYGTDRSYIVGIGNTIDDFLSKSQIERDSIKGLSGHHTYGLHQYFSGNTKYISLVRDPIKRVISFYNYYKFNSNQIMRDVVGDKSLFQLISEAKPNKEYYQNFLFESFNNGQTRCFVSPDSFKEDKVFDQAVSNINQYFVHVGIMEQFEESIILFKQKLGWKNISYIKTNVSNKKQEHFENYEEMIQLIKDKNQFDIQLYNYVKKNQNEQILLNKEYMEKEKMKLNILNPLFKKKIQIVNTLSKIARK